MFESFVQQLANHVLRRMLQLDPETMRRLGELEGKLIRLDIGNETSAITIFVEPSSTGLRLSRESERAADVTMRGSIPVFARLARTGIAAGELQISGDIELGSRFKRILENIELDWEEPLSRVVGDIAAHQVGRAARAARGWGEHAVSALAQDGVEYFQEESRVLAPRVRVEEFLRDVDKVRTDADRLLKRIEQLERGRS